MKWPRKEEREARWFAVAGPGLEGVVGEELRAVAGVSGVEVGEGGVEFVASLRFGPLLNRSVRVVTRVLLRLGEVEARGFGELETRAAALPWQDVLRGGQDVRFDVSAHKSRLYHTGAIGEALARAIGRRLGASVTIAKGARDAEDGELESAPGDGGELGQVAVVRGDGHGMAAGGGQRVFARGVRDRWTISVDASGELLHRRGWRTEAGGAPLRETLAAGMLALARHDPSRPLVDMMCGSGTIAIEAALRALELPPYLDRGFACEAWPVLTKDGARVPPALRLEHMCAPIVGFDQDAKVLEIAGRNAQRAGVAAVINWRQLRWPADAVGPLPATPGLVLINPPYGRRLSDEGRAASLLRTVGRELRRHFGGWRAGVLLADPRWSERLGLPVAETFALNNGGLRVTFALVDVPAR
jgi:putative N6-adenine-specific DNA methylase